MDIDGTLVILRGPAGKLARPDAPNTGPWAHLHQGWRGVIWDDPHSTEPRCRHRVTRAADGNYTFTNEHGGFMGADATTHSGDLTRQFYYKPSGRPAGGYETWRVYDGNENGAIQAQIEYRNDEGAYFSCSVAVEVVG